MKYYLYDLKIETIGDPARFNCSHCLGETLLIRGENISFGSNTKHFSHYALATLIPYIAAKQRAEQVDDWMQFESEIACPDPLCGARFRFIREKRSSYKYEPIECRTAMNNNLSSARRKNPPS